MASEVESNQIVVTFEDATSIRFSPFGDSDQFVFAVTPNHDAIVASERGLQIAGIDIVPMNNVVVYCKHAHY